MSVEREKRSSSGYAERLNYVFGMWRGRSYPRRPTQGDLADAVGEMAGETFGANTASRWLAGVVPREPDVMEALARVLGVDPGWLYFAESSVAPPPPGWEESRPAPVVPKQRGRVVADPGADAARRAPRKRA